MVKTENNLIHSKRVYLGLQSCLLYHSCNDDDDDD